MHTHTRMHTYTRARACVMFAFSSAAVEQLIVSFPEEADRARLTSELTADLSSMCLSPSNLAEGSYSRTLSVLVRLVLAFVLDVRETEAFLTLAGNVSNRSSLFSLRDISEVFCATALLYSKDDLIIQQHIGPASPLVTGDARAPSFEHRLSHMMHIIDDEKSALVFARALSFMLTDFWPARQILQTVMEQWTEESAGSRIGAGESARLIAHAHVTYHVFARMLSLGYGADVADWVCLSLSNIFAQRDWREACICLFSAACGDARQRSLLFLALGAHAADGLTTSSPLPEQANGRDGKQQQNSSTSSTTTTTKNKNNNAGGSSSPVRGVDLDKVFLMAGLMFYNSGFLSEQAVSVFISVCSDSVHPLCHALVSGCLACKQATASEVDVRM